MTITGAEHGFVFISLSDSNLVESVMKIELGEVLLSFESVQKFRNKRKRVSILDSGLVECAVVDTKM